MHLERHRQLFKEGKLDTAETLNRMNRQCLELQIQAVRFSANDPEAQESLDQVLSAIADDELTEEQARKVAKDLHGV